MQLGNVTTLGDLPVYVYQDSDGEQIALPCTERLLSERQAAQVASTGATPVLSLRGRPEVRVGGFRSVAGGMLAGRWAPLELKIAASVAAEYTQRIDQPPHLRSHPTVPTSRNELPRRKRSTVTNSIHC